jgi:hypothetical protein
MAVRNSRSAASDHRRHDRLLVARFATGDAEFGQEREAKDLIRRCSECAALATDINLISKATSRLPAPRRTRDFRLTPEQADNLRGNALERFFRTLSGSGWTIVRPVAGVALSIGLVMSVVGMLPILGGAGLAAAPAAAPTSGQVTDVGIESFPNPTELGHVVAPMASGQPGAENPDDPSRAITAGGNVDNAYLDKTSSPGPDLGPVSQAPAARQSGLSSQDVLFVGGLALAALALLVLTLLYAARRKFRDPLLR